jgi:hypothetical protein
MKIPMKVTLATGEEIQTTAIYPDFIRFEKEFKRPATKMGSDVYLTDIAWLAWSSLSRKGITAIEFDPWTEQLESIELTGETGYVPLESNQPIG